jgi:hypothetical protein
MRVILLLILPLLALTSPAAAQGVVIPLRCQNDCAAELPRTIAMDVLKVWSHLENELARTSADHTFHNTTGDTIDAAFFFPLPEDATVGPVWLFDEEVVAHQRYNLLSEDSWNASHEARWIFDGMMRDRPNGRLRAYRRGTLVYVPLRRLAPGARRRLQVQYSQPLRTRDGAVTWRYPLSTGEDAAPTGHVELGMEVTTEHGFVDVRSPSHEVKVEQGTEMGLCPPQAACGTRSVPSERVKVVRLQPAGDVRRRDFVLVYTPAAMDARNAAASAHPIRP